MCIKKYILVFFIVLFFYPVFSQNDWELKKSSDGINVYTRKTNNSDIYEFKANTTVNASTNDVFNVLFDADNYSQWVDQISYSKKVTSSEKFYLVYYQIDLPIGFKNRDIVLQNNVLKDDNGTITVKLVSAPENYSKKDGFIRIEEAYGYWYIKPAGNLSEVTYKFYSNPKGNFPAWIVNIFIVDGPYKTLKNLKSMF